MLKYICEIYINKPSYVLLIRISTVVGDPVDLGSRYQNVLSNEVGKAPVTVQPSYVTVA